tara:strand:+ start:1306 stop:2031 length:726 start_codon:yes stop_codon:yes gene_type:complete
MKDYTILKIKDKSDSYYTHLKDIFDIPMRLIIVGPSMRSGKSTIILNMLLREKFYKDKFDGENIYIVSNNKMDNKIRILKQEKEVPADNFMTFSESNLEMIYEKVEEACLEAINQNEKPVNSLIILDDCAFSGDLRAKMAGTLSRIFSNGRHCNLSCIVTAQKYSQLSTTIRTNASGAILFSNSAKEVESMSEDFNYLESKKDFVKMFRKVTKDRNSFLVVNFSNDDIYLDSNFKPIMTED